MAAEQGWVIMSFGSDAAWEGNAGYDDDLSSRYQFNSWVPNSRQVGFGDVVIVRSRQRVIGFGRIERIETELGTTQRRRCPECGTTKFNERSSKLPNYRCGNGHTFDSPTSEMVPCTWYTIEYGNSFVPVIPPADVQILEPAYTNAGAQLSIRLVDLEVARKIASESSQESSGYSRKRATAMGVRSSKVERSWRRAGRQVNHSDDPTGRSS